MASFDFGNISAYKFAGQNEVTANTNATAIDTQSFEGVAVVSAVSTSNINAVTSAITVAFLEGDDSNIANATALDSGSIVTNPSLTASNTAFWASVRPTKRYLFPRYLPTADVTANVTTIGALGFPHNAPTQ